MNGKKPMTKSDKARVLALKEMGCQISYEISAGWVLPEIHHILDGGRRISHQHSIPLSRWFHQGVPPEGFDERSAKHYLGPSLALHKREFVARFGAEAEILKRVDARLGEYLHYRRIA